MNTSTSSTVHRLGWIALAVAAALLLGAHALPVALTTPALIGVLLLGPGVLLTRVLPPPRAAISRWGMALVMGVFAVGAPFVALRVLGVTPIVAARAIVALVGGLAIVCALRPPRGTAAPDALEWIPGVMWAVLVGALLVGNASLAPRADGWFHAGVTLQLLDRVPPPEDPYFAGLRLLYFWGMHAWASLWLVLAPQTSVWVPWIVANVAAAAAVLFAVSGMTRLLGASARVAGLAAVLTVVAWSPWGWLQVAARAAAGEVRGWPEVVRLVQAGADPLMDLVSRGQLHASMAFHGDKSLVLTPFGSGIALFVLALSAAIELMHDRRQALTLAVLTAAALFVHTVAGEVIVLTVAVCGLTRLPAALRGDADARAWLLNAMLAIGLAAAALAPYVIVVSAGKQGQIALGTSTAALLTLVLGIGAVLAAAAFTLWRPDPARGTLVATAVTLVLGGLFVDLPESNQSKFFSLLMPAMVAPAALALAQWVAPRRPRWPWRAALLALVFLPTPALCLWAHASEHGQARLSWHAPTQEVAHLFRWARAATSPETVFADLGGARELFTVTGRSVLWGGFDGERDWGHPARALELRRGVVRALCRGETLSEEGLGLLRGLDRPVIVVARITHPETAQAWRLAQSDSAGYHLLREAGGVALLAWSPRR